MKVIADILARLKQKEVIKISQVPNDTSRAWLITEIIHSPLTEKSGGLVVAENYQAAEKMYHNLLFWKSIKNLSIPIFLYSEHISETLYYLTKQLPHIAIIANEELKNLLPPIDDFKNTISNYSIGQSLTYTNITSQLIRTGYDRQSKVFSVGEFAMRGEIIDIHSPGYRLPVRIIFDHEKIADIFFFNPLAQLVDKKITTIDILPIQNISGKATILSYIRSQTILFGSANLDMPISHYPTILWEQLENETNIPIGFSEHLTFKHNRSELLTWLTQHKDWKIIFTSDEYNDWQKKFPHLQIKNGSFISGCKNEKIKLLIATEENLPKIYTDKNNFDTLVGQLFQVGEYVVHVDHGIGKFLGISVQAYDGIPKEFFEIAYAANDKLFVPIEKIDRLSRYVGLTKPTLHRLSGTSWQQLKQKIKKDIYETAHHLIHLYAQREIIEIDPIKKVWPEEKQLAADFPYEETEDQLKALTDIFYDLQKSRPMDRLICGDVGFGKTEIALRTALKIVLNGKQVALLCPTTILAQQHFDTFSKRLEKFGVQIGLLSRFRDTHDISSTLHQLASGHIDIVIGTHRLLSEDVKFNNLGLLIIDEEQKFGVMHKEKLKEFRNFTHILTLSATPIPRTMYFSIVNLKPLSIIQTSPQGRKPIITYIEQYNEEKIVSAIMQEIKRQGQIYYIYNQVEQIDVKAKLIQKLIPTARIAVAHGQMPAAKLAEVMHNFDEEKIDILVCSTIIENGLDLPNVNTLIVEQVNHFGLAQLYQLRGRIGRSDKQAYAYFFYASEKIDGLVAKRLQALAEAKELGSGFTLAKRDMEIRGIGNLLGKAQHGHLQAVGLELYLRLVEQTITEIKTGIPQSPETEVQINLPIHFSIPDTLITTQAARFDLYQKLSRCHTRAEIDTLISKKITSKNLPTEFINLLALLELKFIAQKIGIYEITVREKNKTKYVSCVKQTKFSDMQIKNITNLKLPWQIAEKEMKIEMKLLEKNLLTNLIFSLQTLS